MIDLYYWPSPNGHKITIFFEETGLEYTGWIGFRCTSSQACDSNLCDVNGGALCNLASSRGIRVGNRARSGIAAHSSKRLITSSSLLNVPTLTLPRR